MHITDNPLKEEHRQKESSLLSIAKWMEPITISRFCNLEPGG
jgi:hypothetical protein